MDRPAPARRRLLRALAWAAAALLLPAGATAAPPHPNEVHGDSTFAWKKPPEGAKPVRGGTVVLTLLTDPDSLNRYLSSSVEASEIQDLIYPRLMVEQPDYPKGPPTFTPSLAESWTPGADGLSLRFKLREATWSDGTPITAEDVRFSWQAAKSPEVAWVSASIVDFIRDIEVHGPREFTAHYTERSPYQVMDINDVLILPRHVYGKIPFEKWQTHGVWDEQAKVGGGPFVLEKATPNQEVALVRNPRYWEEGKPYLDRVVFRVVPDMQTMLAGLLAKNFDYMQQVLPKDAKRVLDAGHLNLYSFVSRSFGCVGWNCRRWPFDDAKVRNAMAHAIDKENIVESVYYGHASVAGPHIITSMWASNPAIKPVEFDPEKAESLLREAGWKKGGDGIYAKDGKPLAFKLTTNAGNKIREEICTYIQANLAEVGVKCEINLIEFNRMSQTLKGHDFDAYVGGMYIATKVDLKPTWHSTSTQGSYNYVDYRNPRIDELIDKARNMLDLEASRPLWYELQDILYRDQPMTMVYEPRMLVALSRKIQNAKVTSLRALDNLEEWWISEEK